ncbi:MAG: CBS domain-containing protein, partial [Parvibaculales bacterium]
MIGKKQASVMGKIFSPFSKILRAKNGKANNAPSLRRHLQKLLEGPYDTHTDFTIEELHMLRNLLQFGKLQVQHVMIPRADIDAIEVNSSLKKAIAAFAKASHSRIPVYRDTLDNPLGQIHVKDMMRALAKPPAQQPPLSKIRRKVLFAPPSMPALDLLIQMRSLRVHLALVVDEYGGTDGLVSIEDLVEGVIGQIEDEHDTPSVQTLRKLKNGQLEASARISVKAMSSILSPLIKREGWGDVDTLGGVVFRLAGRVPQRGE